MAMAARAQPAPGWAIPATTSPAPDHSSARTSAIRSGGVRKRVCSWRCEKATISGVRTPRVNRCTGIQRPPGRVSMVAQAIAATPKARATAASARTVWNGVRAEDELGGPVGDTGCTVAGRGRARQG